MQRDAGRGRRRADRCPERIVLEDTRWRTSQNGRRQHAASSCSGCRTCSSRAEERARAGARRARRGPAARPHQARTVVAAAAADRRRAGDPGRARAPAAQGGPHACSSSARSGVLSLALVVMTATLDRTIRVPNDITRSSASTCWPSSRTCGAEEPWRQAQRRRKSLTMFKRKRPPRPLDEFGGRRRRRAGDPRRGRTSCIHMTPSRVAVGAALLPRPGPAARHRGLPDRAGADVGPGRRGRHVRDPVARRRRRLRHRVARSSSSTSTGAGHGREDDEADAARSGSPTPSRTASRSTTSSCRPSNPRLSLVPAGEAAGRPAAGARRQQGPRRGARRARAAGSTTCCSTCRRCWRRARR